MRLEGGQGLYQIQSNVQSKCRLRTMTLSAHSEEIGYICNC